MTCDFSGYLPRGYTISWTGPQGVVIGNNSQHTLVSGEGDGQSQSGGGFPGPSVLATLNISMVEKGDTGNYTCRMTGANSVQLMGIVKLSAMLGETIVKSNCIRCF